MASLYENTHQLIGILENYRYPVTTERLLNELSCSKAKLYRILKYAQISGYEICNSRGIGYSLNAQSWDQKKWKGFTPQELEGLAVLWQMVENLPNGWLSQYKEIRSALLARLRTMGIPVEQWENRVIALPQHQRKTDASVFRKVSHALLHRKVIRFHYKRFGKAEEQREVHPQQLILYRNGWSLDALDVSKVHFNHAEDQGIRQFSLDLMSSTREVKKKWISVPAETLKKEFESGYGLFAGQANSIAVIKFTNLAAFYVQREIWHKEQRIEVKSDGTILLSVPYVKEHPEELLGDILRWADSAQIMEPQELKNLWKNKVQKMWESLNK